MHQILPKPAYIALASICCISLGIYSIWLKLIWLDYRVSLNTEKCVLVHNILCTLVVSISRCTVGVELV